MLKSSRNWWLAGLTSLLLAGCQQAPAPDDGKGTTPPETTPQQKQLAESLETWNALKAENGDYYRYETSFSSFAGFGSTTTLTVQNEQVVTRAYRSYVTNEDGEQKPRIAGRKRVRRSVATKQAQNHVP